MKYLFNFWLFFIVLVKPCLSREIIVITYDTFVEQAILAKQLLTQQLAIPEKLISLKHSFYPCAKVNNPIVHFCFDHSGELRLVEMKKEIVTKSFGVFKNTLD